MKPSGWLLCALVFACASANVADPPKTASGPAVQLAAALPADQHDAPSQMKIAERDPQVSPSDVDGCASCHTDVAEQWKTSVHFFASFDNPVYRASVLRFRKEKGEKASRFCGGCHDPSLMVDGAMDHEIPSDDLRAFSGVTCRTCHGAIHARPDGNASLDLRIAPIEIPKEGDTDSVARHKVAAAPAPLRTAGLCMACHRVFLDEGSGNAHHLPGQDEGTPWIRSAFSGAYGERLDEDVPVKDCRGCHMPKEDATLGDAAAKNGKITSHRFVGGHSWLAAMRRDPDQLARITAFLKTAATIDVVGARVGDGKPQMLPSDAAIAAGDRIEVDVAIKNVGVGHRFPGGVLDAQDTWVELRAFDARGRLVASAGDAHDKTNEPTFAPGTHVLHAVILDDGGQPVLARETEKFRVTVVNQTIAPRDAQAVRYELVVPELPSGSLPLRFVAKLRHRSRSLAVHDASCAHEKTPESRAFDAGLRKSYAFVKPLDACVTEPIVDIAEAQGALGPGAGARDASRDFERAYAWGQGLLHVLQEHVDEARAPLVIAEAAAKSPLEHAMAMSLLGQLAAKQGRVDEAFSWEDQADKLAGGPQPFSQRVRGEALASVWKFTEAVPYLRDAAQTVLRDDSLWSELAVALGSANQSAFALEASRCSLALQPRDSDALRVQALALESLGAPADQIKLAKDAYLTRRVPDEGAAIKGKCSARVPGCALERDPVRLHPMTIASPR